MKRSTVLALLLFCTSAFSAEEIMGGPLQPGSGTIVIPRDRNAFAEEATLGTLKFNIEWTGLPKPGGYTKEGCEVKLVQDTATKAILGSGSCQIDPGYCGPLSYNVSAAVSFSGGVAKLIVRNVDGAKSCSSGNWKFSVAGNSEKTFDFDHSAGSVRAVSTGYKTQVNGVPYLHTSFSATFSPVQPPAPPEKCYAAINGNQISVPYLILARGDTVSYASANFSMVTDFDGAESYFRLDRVVPVEQRNCEVFGFIADDKTLIVPAGPGAWAGLYLDKDASGNPVFYLADISSGTAAANRFEAVPAVVAGAVAMCTAGAIGDMALNVADKYMDIDVYPPRVSFINYQWSDADVESLFFSAGTACALAVTPIGKIPGIGPVATKAVQKLQQGVDLMRRHALGNIIIIKQSLAGLARNLEQILYTQDPLWYRISKAKTYIKQVLKDTWVNIGMAGLIHTLVNDVD